MSCQIVEQTSVEKIPAWMRLIELLSLPLSRGDGTPGKIDLDDMPDRVKRDMGFLDGREPRYEDDLRR
ncbi:hypothetical protein DTW90_02710 [Neorhizobium sp. P12A]|uniref:hypothetical protein n=1 Tax=Neorhizobium sp. P12A TaxID=2268027 RepID=UPI0011F07AC5|nr:hypothetical protein [Neorhizobium sp. P12A]KAA0700580.1 hypothetical protein DTW90_02710 [Neorhizobium sp. P12A]